MKKALHLIGNIEGTGKCISIANESSIKRNGSLGLKKTVLEYVHSGLGCSFHRDS